MNGCGDIEPGMRIYRGPLAAVITRSSYPPGGLQRGAAIANTDAVTKSFATSHKNDFNDFILTRTQKFDEFDQLWYLL